MSIKAKEQQQTIEIVAIATNNPYSFRLPDNSVTGYYVELWKLWSYHNNIPVNFTLTSFENSINAIKDETADLHIGLFNSEQRRQWASFSEPFDEIKSGIWYHNTRFSTGKFSDFNGYKVAVQKGSYQENHLSTNYPEIRLVGYEDDTSIYQLLNDEIQGIMAEIPYLHQQIAKLSLSGVFSYTTNDVLSNRVHGMILKNKPELLELINHGFSKIPLKEWQALQNKWLPMVEPFNNTFESNTFLTTAEQNWLNEHQNLKMGVDPFWPPFDYINSEGEHNGIAADYINHLHKELNLQFILQQNISWSKALEETKKGFIDILPAVIKSDERTQYLNFTIPYMELPTVIVTRNDNFYVESFNDLENKALGLLSGSVYTKIIPEDYPLITLVEVDSVADGLSRLEAGTLDAFFDAIAVVNYEINKGEYNNLNIAAFTPYKIEISIGIRKGLEPLVGIFNKALSSMSDKEKSSIANSWLSIYVQTGTELLNILRWTIPILLIMLLIILFVVRSNKRMQAEILERLKAEKSLQTAKKEAELANRAKSEFLANMSHEIRTPMNAVIGMATLLEDTGLNEQQKSYVNILHASSSTLMALINDVLDLSKIEEGKLELENIAFTLQDVIDNVTSQIKLTLDSSKIKFELQVDTDVPERLKGDPLRLSQILLNITNNACKFTQQGKVSMFVSAVNSDKQTVTVLFRIKDTGIGMSKQQLSKLFKTYSQADSSISRKYGGTGLGLTICKHLSELMSGTIEVESSEGSGSTFNIRLVFDKAEENLYSENAKMGTEKITVPDKSQGQKNNSNQFKEKNILLVDDNRVNLIVAEKVLIKAGINVTTAANGQKAVEEAMQKSFDLILMDIQMPVMDGYQATREIKKLPSYKTTPIIALSANAMKEDYDKSQEAGMDAHLSKPLNVEILTETLSKFLS